MLLIPSDTLKYLLKSRVDMYKIQDSTRVQLQGYKYKGTSYKYKVPALCANGPSLPLSPTVPPLQFHAFTSQEPVS